MKERFSPSVRRLQRIVDVRAGEIEALLWSAAYFFCILASYYILRPMREEMGVAGGVSNLPWLYTGTLAVMLLANPAFAAMVARLPRRRFIALTYRFFMANLLVFFVLMRVLPEDSLIWLGRAFFVWISVFNLFVVSVFWALMSDLYRVEQGKRLFGFIGVGGTLGGVVGAGLTALLAARVGPEQLLLGSVLLLEGGVYCVRRLSRISRNLDATPAVSSLGREEAQRQAASTATPPGAAAGGRGADEERIGGHWFAGITHVVRSPYLLGICLYMLLFTINSTVLYFQQAEIAARVFDDRVARTAFFARIDFAVNALTVLTQLFLTGRVIRILGVGVTLALLPGLCMLGFTGLGMWPTLMVMVLFQVLRRAGNYAVARPARETLYTVVPREDKFKAKSFIDTFVYRGGDQVGAWSYRLLTWFGLSMASIAFLTVPVAGMWLLVALWLGRRQTSLARGLSSSRK